MNFNTLGKLETDPECIHYLGLKLRPSARLKQEKKLVKLERPQSARVMARSHSFWKGPSRHCKKLCLRAWPKDTSTHQSVKQHLLSKDAAACIAATSRHINRHERHERHERQERHGNCSSFPGSGSSRLSFEFVNHLYPKSKAPHSANQEIAKMKGSGRVFFVLSRRAPTTLTNLVLQANMVARFCTVAADVVCKALWNLRIEVPQPKETRKLDTANIAKPSVVLTHRKKP